jgi:hypothetical protein
MSSVIKALDLLSHFSASQPEIGLSQLCRIAKRDKATTYRHLQALEVTGFIEQNSATKHYRLGPAVLQLAEIREATVPRKSSAEDPLFDLAVPRVRRRMLPCFLEQRSTVWRPANLPVMAHVRSSTLTCFRYMPLRPACALSLLVLNI